MSPNKRRIAVFTGNRAEYGLQSSVLQAIANDPRLEYFLLVSGAHLKEEFGQTLTEIKAEGFDIYAQVVFDSIGEALFSVAQAIGSGIVNISRVLNELRPDMLVVYADRSESFAAVIASTQMGIPTAHIEGGDYTDGGALDDSVRHAMTKLAHLHFTTNQQSAERVLRLGEEPWRVFNVGLPGLDLISAGQFVQPDEVYQRLDLDPKFPILMFTQHSITTEVDQAARQVQPSLSALEEAGREWGCQTIITYPNNDAGGRAIIEEKKKLAAKGLSFIRLQPNLGRRLYHGVLNVASVCVGNSSSGIKETPAFACPTVNIGDRQRGRLAAANVINVGYDKEQIKKAIWKALFDEEFKELARTCENPYSKGGAGTTIAGILATVDLSAELIQKKMTY